MIVFGQIIELIQWIIIIILLFFMSYVFRKSYEAISANMKSEAKNSTTVEIGSIFPYLRLRTITDKIIDLHTFKFSGSIILFSMHGCSGCEKLYPHMNSINDEFSSFQVVSVMISPLKNLFSKKEKYDLKLPIHHVELGEMHKYGTHTFPYCYILSSTGEVINKGIIQDKEGIYQLLQKSDSNINAIG
ncbi:AhpC/TSA family protein [Fontibacillus panacisegetis]|uniref:AhpC/TSA family protein n=2 Tax=Fontibacillus panacisegetis TaxID=670482 RepID=A0A1G7VHR3_9BACL|nr:redoxin domain-containing protein [Fontibacillus panacisegetis]SDG58939.1 AhpC/TSA family protein [Fontibacillus panacisegetis]